MKILKELDLREEEAQLRLVKKLKDAGDDRHRQALETLHCMLARKTLDYYCADGYDAFFERYNFDKDTDDGYHIAVRGHDMTVSIQTAFGTLTGRGSTWDYISDDLEVAPRPAGMKQTDYNAVKKRMAVLQDAERVVYPFHSLHRIANGYFDTKVCMYNAHGLIKQCGGF